MLLIDAMTRKILSVNDAVCHGVEHDVVSAPTLTISSIFNAWGKGYEKYEKYEKYKKVMGRDVWHFSNNYRRPRGHGDGHDR